MPKPKPRETEQDFVSRCIPVVIDEGTAEDNQQAAAICHSIFRESKKMTQHELLVKAIRERAEKQTEFNYGILPADRWVKSLETCVGSDLCYRYAAKGNVSFDDMVKRAQKTLTYNNQEMVIEDLYAQKATKLADFEFEMPKNTLMVFRHVLTTPKKDRDGDILRTQGAKPDPKMLLLWQHVHTLPIGKMLGIVEHNSKTLSVVTAIVDMNELAHDSAVMVENKMGRFSHGFKALEFTKFKAEDGVETNSPGGFDVKVFEIMEESLVSVPANTDAETEEVIVSLVEGGKLTSPMMKSYGEHFRQKMPSRFNIPIGLDLDLKINGKSINADLRGNGSATTKGEGCGCGTKPCSCASEEADGGKGEGKAKAEDKEMICPECGSKMTDGVCEKCGYRVKEEEDKGHAGDAAETAASCPQCGGKLDDSGTCQQCGYIQESGKGGQPDGEKAGRVLSKANYAKLVEARDDMKEIDEMHVSTRSGKTMCKACMTKLDEVIKSAGKGEGETSVAELTAKELMAEFLSKSTETEQKRMTEALGALETLRKRQKQTESYREFVRGK